jgi:DNA-directed RNA polymerase subunit RPC12/RpoP
VSAALPLPRLCEQCGTDLPVPSSPRRQFCDDCNRKRNNAFSKEKRAFVHPTNCGQCGAPINRAKRGMRRFCVPCGKKRNSDKHNVIQIARNAAWRAAGSPKEKTCSDCGRNYHGYCARCYAKKNRKRLINAGLKSRFGITLERFDEMIVAQCGRCSICGRPMTSGKGACVDHNHTTGKVRDLLCLECNHAIGLMKENPDRMRSAADYVERHNSTEEMDHLQGYLASAD